MRVFISADIEGIATTSIWPEAQKGQPGYPEACLQMTREVAAACRGAIAAGADYIRVKDAHSSGTNIDPHGLPRQVELTRSSCGSPWSMVYGVTDGFDAAMFIGYHAAAGRSGNPLSHTETTSTVYVKLNGVKCSEFQLYSWACAMANVPSVLLAGDATVCEDSAMLHPKLITVPVKRGFGGATTSLHPDEACARIEEGAKRALSQDLTGALPVLPNRYTLEICYKEQVKAARMSFFPGFKQVSDNIIRLTTRDYYEILRAVVWVL